MPLPSVIGKYQVVDRLGQGGMGTLYLARDPYLDRLVAIKVLRVDFDDEELRDRFAREARAVSRLSSHQNIVTIFEYGSFEGQPFIAMQYVAGESLAELIHRRAALPIDRKLRIVDEICAGMAAAHRLKIVHRDLKPANIMIDADSGLVKILDFGIARNLEANVTLHTQVIGTPSYMSPEQASGRRVDERSDIFAIGAVAYELFSYRKAFDGESTGEIQRKILEQNPAPLERLCPGIDTGLIAFVDKALEKNPANRYQDLETARVDLSRVADRMAQSVAEPTIVVTPPGAAKAAHTPQPSPHLEQRRASQIKRYLEAARSAFDDKDYEAAVESCEHVLLLDATHHEALSLLQQTRKAIDRLNIERYLSDARRALEAGLLTDADRALSAAAKLDSGDPSVVALQRTLQHARQEMERALERALAAEAALSRARSSLDYGALESALRATSEALAHKPDSSDALALKERITRALEQREREREQERAALNVVRDARAQFEQGQHTAAIRSLETASPSHPLIAAALDDLRARREALDAKRREEELHRRIAQLAETSEERLAAADFDAALDAVAAIERLDRDAPEAADLRTRAHAARAAAEAAAKAAVERARQAAIHVAQAERLLEAGDLDRALAEVKTALSVDPAEARAGDLAKTIVRAIDDRDRRERERVSRVEALLKTSRASFAAANYDEALDQLAEAERLGAPVREVNDLRTRIGSARDEARAAAEALQQRRAQIDAAIVATEQSLHSGDLDNAKRQINAALALDAADDRARQLLAAVDRAVADRKRQEAERATAAERARKEAEEAQRRAEAERRRHAELDAQLGETERLLNARMLDEALRAAEAAVALDPKDSRAAGLLERVRAAIVERVRADAEAERTRREAEAARRRREEEERQQRAEAEAAAAALKKKQRQLESTLADVRRLLAAGKLEKAQHEVDAALGLDGADAQAQQLREQIRTALEDRARAEEQERKARAEDEARRQKEDEERRSRLETLIATSRTLVKSADYDRALTALSEAEFLDPKSRDVTLLRTQIRTRRDEEAAAAEALKKRQREIGARLAEARRSLDAGKLDKAQREADAALGLDGADVQAQQLHDQIRVALEDRARTQAEEQKLRTQIREAKAEQARGVESPKGEPRPAWLKPAAALVAVIVLIAAATLVRQFFLSPSPVPTSITTEQTAPPPPSASTTPETGAVAPPAPVSDRGRTESEATAGQPPKSPERGRGAEPPPPSRGVTPARGETSVPVTGPPVGPSANQQAQNTSVLPVEPPTNPTTEPSATGKIPDLGATSQPPPPVQRIPESAPVNRDAVERRAIEQLLNEYASAYNSLNASALARLYPTGQVSFEIFKSVRVTLNLIRVEIIGDSAFVTCSEDGEQVMKRASQRIPIKSTAMFQLRRRGPDSWIIDSVRTQPR